MSTNSGEDGYCPYCGHAMNGHAADWESACKKCDERFVICQERHGNRSGWRICLIPCDCGTQHYPDKANAAKPLKARERVDPAPLTGYAPTIAGPSSAAMAALLGSSSSHVRTLSAESVDPLQWPEERLQSDGGLLTGLAALSIAAPGPTSVAPPTVEVSARWNSDGNTVTLKSFAGDKIATVNRENIQDREDGIWVYINGTWYFAVEIKGAKKAGKKAAKRR